MPLRGTRAHDVAIDALGPARTVRCEFPRDTNLEGRGAMVSNLLHFRELATANDGYGIAADTSLEKVLSLPLESTAVVT